MANQWTWETVTEGLVGEWREFIRLCNRRLKDLQVKVASLVSYPVGGGTAGNFPVWDSTGTGLSDGALSQLASPSRVVSTRSIRLPFNAAIMATSESGTLEFSLIKLFTGDVMELLGAWHIASADANLRPVSDDAFDLGSSAKRVRRLYLSGDIEGGSGGFAHTIHGWYQDNVTASQTNVELTHAAGRWTAVRAGSVLGVVVHATEARTAGTLTVDVFKNTGLAGAAGSSIGLTAVLNGTDTSRKATTQAKDTDTFAAGDEIYAVVTTDGSWAPTTSDIRVSILVEC